MKIILSRKGFDSVYGGCASPIFPDGSMVSLPVPAEPKDGSGRCFSDLHFRNFDMGKVAADLSRGRVRAESEVHLDPDLDAATVERAPEWRPAFGQGGGAQAHLQNHSVGKGDLFLFFGWFRDIRTNGSRRWEFDTNAADRHVLFGWLQVDEVFPIAHRRRRALELHPWLQSHPHFKEEAVDWQLSTVYLAKETLDLPIDTGGRLLPGGGTFDKIAPERILTDVAQPNRSVWKLPGWFLPDGSQRALTYHGEPKRWSMGNDGWVRLSTVGRGQEFVLHADDYPLAQEWLADLLSV